MLIDNGDGNGDDKDDDNSDDGVLTIHTVPTTRQDPSNVP